MEKSEIIKNAINEMDLKYIEEPVEPKTENASANKISLLRKPAFLAAAAVLICLLIGGVVTAVILANRPVKAETPPEDASLYAPTGHPGKELQRAFVYHAGTVYVDFDGVESLPKDAREIGTIQKIDNYVEPDEELEASHLGIGWKVYIDDAQNRLYVDRKDGFFQVMVVKDW